jgi:hypothetical protein
MANRKLIGPIETRDSMEVRAPADHKVNYDLMIVLYYLFKLAAPLVSCIAVYLGYRLFILGVTGQASLNVESKSVSAQLLNAAPGLFFAIGGLVTLGISIFKGVEVRWSPRTGR